MLLRAVNLGGATQVDLSALVDALGQAGLGEVRSLLNSGNFVFSSPPGKPEAIERLVSASVERTAGRPVPVFLRTSAEWASVLSANPFPDEAENDPGHLHVAFLRKEATDTACRALTDALPDGERLRAFGRHAFVYYPKGSGQSKLTARRLELALGSESTSRNWNTVRRIATLVLPDSS